MAELNLSEGNLETSYVGQRVQVVSPRTEGVHSSGDAADKPGLFAKVHDVAPDGSGTLVNRLVPPVRVPDVTRSFTVQLPGTVHRYEAGHRLEFAIVAGDSAYVGNRGIKPVAVVSSPQNTGVPCWSCPWSGDG